VNEVGCSCYMSTVEIEPEQTWTIPTLTNFDGPHSQDLDPYEFSSEEMLFLVLFVASVCALLLTWRPRA
jgi:hypothetical protein